MPEEKKERIIQEFVPGKQVTLAGWVQRVRKMGGMNDMLSMLPGGSKIAAEVDEDEMNKNMARTEAIILSMTPKERRDPRILNASRKRRIAAGSGTTVQQINQLLKQFEQTQAMIKQFGQMGKKGRRGMKMPFKF